MLAGSRDPEATTAVALCTAGTLAIPVAALRWELEAEALPYLAASSALQLAYFALLAGAYRRADLSVVYPLARGSAPVLVLGLAALVTGAATSGRQAVGVALVGAGVLLVRGLRRGRGVGIGLLIGAVIATYTVIDKEGIEHASPLAYVTVITIVPGLAYTGALVAARGARALRPALGPRAVAAGLGSLGAYGLVLAALELAPAASVAAVRESSILIGTALGALVLRERVTLPRAAGALVLVAGVALVAGA